MGRIPVSASINPKLCFTVRAASITAEPLGKRRISNIHLKSHLNNGSLNVGPFPSCIETTK